MPPILMQQPATDRREHDTRHPVAHAGSPPAGAEQASFSWRDEARVDNARTTRRYLDGLRETAATPEQRKRGVALLLATARRLRKRQTPAEAADARRSSDAETTRATPVPRDSAPPPARRQRRQTPRQERPAEAMAAHA